jgi:hypothetical protein
LLAKFDQGDREIDDMLRVVIDKLDSLNLKSQNLGTEISKQQRMISKMGQNIETSWKKLDKKDSELSKILTQYKK